MLIRINLLAESQEAEEARTRDPVKRAIWIAAFFVCVILVWMLKLRLDIGFFQLDYRNIENRTVEIDTQNSAAASNLIEIARIDRKLAALDRLTTNRFLWAPLLGALENTMVDYIQVIRVTGDQTYTIEDSGAGTSNQAAMPGAIVERISLSIQARDMSPDAQACNKYKESLNSCDYFVKNLKRRDGFVLDDILRPPVTGVPDSPGQFNTFVLVSHFPEVRRGD